MASTGYEQGVPDLLPSVQGPVPYQDVRPTGFASISKFGDQIAATASYFDNAAADDALNRYQEATNKILRGSSTGTGTPGADGQLGQQDFGYLGLNGRAALDARPDTEKQIEDLYKQEYDKLTPSQQAMFKPMGKKYKTSLISDVSQHANGQATVWYSTVNKTASDLALDRASADPLNVDVVKGAFSDLIQARTKDAELAGAKMGDPVWLGAVDGAKHDMLVARVKAIGTDNPSMAMDILKRNRAAAGQSYDELYNSLEAGANQQDALDLGVKSMATSAEKHAVAQSTSYANPAQPIYTEAAAEIPGGLSPAGLARLVQIESNGNPSASNASDHVGLTQFSAATWKEFGQGDRTDPQQSILAAQRYAASNAKYLTRILGRPPTDAELYIAHQQGPGGAAKLFANPNAPAASIVGMGAVLQNGGKADMTAAEFTALWTHKFNGTAPSTYNPPAGVDVGHPDKVSQPAVVAPVAPQAVATVPGANTAPGVPEAPSGSPELPSEGIAPQSQKLLAYQAIDESDASPQVKALARTYVNQQLAAEKAALDAETAAKKARDDQTVSAVVSKILSGDTKGLYDNIVNSDLSGPDKLTLTNAMTAHADQSVAGATAAYGDGYYTVLGQVTAQPGDPSRITDNATLIRMAIPDANGRTLLTMDGAEKLITLMADAKKNPDAAAVADTQKAMLGYVRQKIVHEVLPNWADPNGKQDPAGERLYGRFINNFYTAYGDWTEKQGKPPLEFLTPDNMDNLLNSIETPQEAAMRKLLSTSAMPTIASTAPAGVNPDAWTALTQIPVVTFDGGKPLPVTANWTGILTELATRPTPAAISYFDKHFSASLGLTATDILDALGVQAKSAVAVAPRAEAAVGVIPEPALAAPVVAPPEVVTEPDLNIWPPGI